MSTFVLFGVVDIIVSERRRECDDVPVLGHEDLNNCSIPIDFSVDVDHVGYMFVFVRLVIRPNEFYFLQKLPVQSRAPVVVHLWS